MWDVSQTGHSCRAMRECASLFFEYHRDLQAALYQLCAPLVSSEISMQAVSGLSRESEKPSGGTRSTYPVLLTILIPRLDFPSHTRPAGSSALIPEICCILHQTSRQASRTAAPPRTYGT